jgi:hypothetical protein
MHTAQDYIDELKLSIKRHHISQEMSDAEILTYINRARNQVQKVTMGLYPERYSRVWMLGIGALDIEPNYDQTNTYGALGTPSNYVQVAVVPLPADFIDMEVVKARWQIGGRLEVSEARRVTLSELHSTCMHAFNYPTMSAPLYAVDRVGTGYMLYIAPSLTGVDLDLYDMSVELWYIAAVMDMQNFAGTGLEDTDVQIPIEFQPLVLMFAELYVMSRVAPDVMPNLVVAEIKRLTEMLGVHYQIDKNVREVLLPSKEA